MCECEWSSNERTKSLPACVEVSIFELVGVRGVGMMGTSTLVLVRG